MVAPFASEAGPKHGAVVRSVEDEPDVRMLAREALEEAGFRLLEAQQGVEALALAKKHRGAIHLLLTDVVMPEMGGPELAERMAAAHPEMKVLFMSGYAAARSDAAGS